MKERKGGPKPLTAWRRKKEEFHNVARNKRKNLLGVYLRKKNLSSCEKGVLGPAVGSVSPCRREGRRSSSITQRLGGETLSNYRPGLGRAADSRKRIKAATSP